MEVLRHSCYVAREYYIASGRLRTFTKSSCSLP